MTTQTEVLTNGEKHEEKATDRDLQRQALRGLVILSEQCAADEADIEKRHETGLANEAQAYERATWAADQNAKGVEDSIKQKYEERLGKIQAQFDSDTAAIREANDKGKRKVQAEFTPQEQEIKKKYDEALWLADAELEARQNQIRLEQKKANEDLKTHGEEIDDLEGRAISLLKTYRHKPSDMDMSQMATAEGEKPEPGNYAAKRDAAMAELSRLQSLFAPQLMVGARPFLIVLVLLGIAGGAAWFKNMDKAFDFNDYIVPCGAALAIAVVLGVIFMMVGKSGVRRHWTRTKKHLDEARKASKVDHENTLKELEARTEAAKQKRATEAAALKEKYSPRLGAVQEKKKAALAANEAQTNARMKTYEEKRQGLVKETEAWQVRHQEELKVKLAKQLENLQIKHEAKMKEIEDKYQQEKADLEKRWKDGLVEVSKPMQESDHEGIRRTVYDWEGTNWEKWAPPKTFTTLVRFGELQVDLKTITDQYPRRLALPEAFSVPANLAFPRQSSLLIHAD
ncbi:MAG TPA: hypothetical protein VEV81_12190, partial [Pyrinomonadaceae bacterium]|nr:hypothetical protein [Pyrinomonadaceae bacterium]